jgi:SAM-dependent methyltransferase
VSATYDDDELAALYDLFYGDLTYDLPMYESFARRGESAVLELAAGTGRVALFLARAGIDVVALDSAPAMLRRLQAAVDGDGSLAARVKVIEADMRGFRLDQRFGLVFCAINSFQHLLTTDDQLAALRCVRAHLSPGGIFVAELRSPAAVDWSATDALLQHNESRIDPATGERIDRIAAVRAHPGTLRRDTTFFFDRIGADGAVRRRVFDYTLKYTTPDELALLLRAAGLRLAQLYGDCDLSPFTESSDSMIVVAEREEA